MNIDMKFLMSLSRQAKRGFQASFDAGVLIAAFPLAMALRLERLDFLVEPSFWACMALYVPCGILIIHSLGIYRPLVRYISTTTMIKLVLGCAVSVALLTVLAIAFDAFLPRSVPFIVFMIALLGTIGGRFVVRSVYRQILNRTKTPVMIFGAGEIGQQLVPTLQQGREYNPRAMIDPTRENRKLEISGVTVYGPEDIESLLERYSFTHVLIALDIPTVREKRAIVNRFAKTDLTISVVPSLAEIVAGNASISDVRPVPIEELMGRDPVEPKRALIEVRVKDQHVLVSGAGGSIGSELCRQIARNGAASLTLVETSEFALYSIDQELRQIAPSLKIVPQLASVTDADAMRRIIKDNQIDTIYHAAAYKHVPLVEDNVAAGIENNVFGTQTIAQVAHEAGVKSFTLVSTDKAVRPTNVMGASKRVAELICQGLAAEGSDTVFSMVRFGNVLGSSGSVIPLFRRQIAEGGPVTVTDPEITRYFMTIPEAAGLVLQASGMAEGGDTFLLDMGEPVKIVDLATRMVTLSGATPFITDAKISKAHGVAQEGSMEIRFSGLRPGEKLYEELLIDDNAVETGHPRIMRVNENHLSKEDLTGFLGTLQLACDSAEDASSQVRTILMAQDSIHYRPRHDHQIGSTEESAEVAQQGSETFRSIPAE